MTKKLYYDSSYLIEWETKCIKKFERENEYFVVLEESAFYPEGGGQPSDEGTINGIPVLDVFNEDAEVLHKVEVLPEGDKVRCLIDWKRRFDHMQQHSGQHLLSAVCLTLLNARTVSFHLGKEYASIDIDIPDINPEQVKWIEDEVNKQVFMNRKITSYFITNEQLKEITLVKKPKVTEYIRIVEIEDIEYNACGGTHVSQTGEIGMIKIIKVEKQKGMVRLFFKCGYRAQEDYNSALQILSRLSARFNTGRNTILDRVDKWDQDQQDMEKQLESLNEKLESYQINELLQQTKGKIVAHVFEDKALKDLLRLASKLAEEDEFIVLLASTAENKVILKNNGTKESIACGQLFKAHLSKFNGKGGGNAESAQAGFTTSEDLQSFVAFLKDYLIQNQ